MAGYLAGEEREWEGWRRREKMRETDKEMAGNLKGVMEVSGE